jgi:hypothetical protein
MPVPPTEAGQTGTPDSLDLDADRSYTVSLPSLKSREVIALLGPGWPHRDTPLHRSIGAAAATEGEGGVPVSLRGWDWETVIGAVAEWASACNDPRSWRLVDTLSAKVGGPPRPAMGFPRA